MSEVLFDNPFKLEDLLVFDDATMGDMLQNESFGLKLKELAHSAQNMPAPIIEHFKRNLPTSKKSHFLKELRRPLQKKAVEEARQQMLDNLFWELTYWKTPELYEELTAGENLHPGIFQQLGQILQDKIVLDAGAGSGRASFECLKQGAKQVFAVEPSPGLRHIMAQKLAEHPAAQRVTLAQGRFDNLPLDDHSVDVAISCSAFTAEPEQGGEPGLAELKRVTRPGGKIVIIWPRREDHAWLKAQGFKYVRLPLQKGHEMKVQFRSLGSALRCARRFYYKNRTVLHYLLKHRRPEIPFSILGFNPPHDYCILEV